MADVDCLVSPMACWGPPHEACSARGILTIFVKEDIIPRRLWTSMFQPNVIVESYLEAAGFITAMRAGISVESVRRPLAATEIYD